MTKTTMSTDLLQPLKIFTKLAFKVVGKELKSKHHHISIKLFMNQAKQI